MRKWLAFIEKRRLTATVIIICTAVAMIAIIPWFFNERSFGEDYLNKMYLVSQIISAIFVIAGVIIGVWQYYITSKNHNQNIAKEQIERAIRLAEYYKDNVLPLYAAINFIFEQSGAKVLLQTAKCENMQYFNKNEIKRVYSQEVIARVKAINSSEKLAKCILMAESIYQLNLRLPHIAGRDEDETENKRLVLNSFGSEVISKALNNLEYFAFNFTHNVADESVIYQSLAPTYIDLVELLYYLIAQANDPNVAVNYYTNVTELYSIWKKRQSEQQEKIDREHISPVCKGSVL